MAGSSRDSKKKKSTGNPPSPDALRRKMAEIREKLAEMQAYKRLMAAEGIEADADDKVRESDLIVRLLRIEKQLGIRKPARGGQGRPGSAGKTAKGGKGDRKPAAAKPRRAPPKGKPAPKGGSAPARRSGGR